LVATFRQLDILELYFSPKIEYLFVYYLGYILDEWNVCHQYSIYRPKIIYWRHCNDFAAFFLANFFVSKNSVSILYIAILYTCTYINWLYSVLWYILKVCVFKGICFSFIEISLKEILGYIKLCSAEKYFPLKAYSKWIRITLPITHAHLGINND
jgi:hypothetical protein